jgi:hypothetical protein
MGKRFAIVIDVAAVGVMALGAQTAAQTQAPTPPGQAVTCKGQTATIVGTDGNNDLSGTPARDVMAGLGGQDVASGNVPGATFFGAFSHFLAVS